MKGADILIIEDEEPIRRLLGITLRAEGMIPREAGSGRTGLHEISAKNPDLIILDLGLPDIPGQNLLQTIRHQYSTPVIILSVQSSEEDIIRALDNGADDYLVKPFRTGELLARIRSSLRKSGMAESGIVDCGQLQIDLDLRLVRKGGEPVKLTATEFNLLSLLVRNEGKVLTHQFLLRAVWGPGYIEQTQYLRVFIAQLRKKIEKEPDQPMHLVTESGLGYRFIANV